MNLNQTKLHLYLQMPNVQYYLRNIRKKTCNKDKIIGNLAMAIYNGASQSPRLLRYRDAFLIANNLVEYSIKFPNVIEI